MMDSKFVVCIWPSLEQWYTAMQTALITKSEGYQAEL